MNLNEVTLIGNLTRDPELREIGDSMCVVNFTVAVNRNYQKKDGQWESETTFIDCEAWDSGAKRLNESFSKGSEILVQGSLKLDTWETEGQKRSKLKVRVARFQKTSKNAPSREATENTAVEATENTAVEAKGDAVENQAADQDDPNIPF